jgi:hypothetical protein
MTIDLDSIKNVLISLGSGAVVWEVLIKPSIGGFISFFYAEKLEGRKSRSAKELEQFKMELLHSLEEIRRRNSKEIEELKRSFDSLLKRQEMQLDAQLKSKINADETIFDKELSIYQEVVEVIYRCRNLARECLSTSQRKTNRRVLSDFSQYKVHLTENLYKYKVFFSEDIFRKLHRFKVEIQEYSILLDEVTRSTDVDDAPVDPEIRELAEAQMPIRYATINSLQDELSSEIEKYLRQKRL